MESKHWSTRLRVLLRKHGSAWLSAMVFDKGPVRWFRGWRLWLAIFALHCIAVSQILFLNHVYYFLVRYSKTACDPITVSSWCEAAVSCVQVSKDFLENAGMGVHVYNQSTYLTCV